MIKITINVDTSTLAEIRSIASQTGVPYQRLLNRLLKESLIKKDRTSSRLDKLEKEVHRLKKTIAA